ncbi:hypothetical protein D918_06759 [Trichuris suis]|nr:hypothetical protein D918_06759 [Trichuris suis]
MLFLFCTLFFTRQALPFLFRDSAAKKINDHVNAELRVQDQASRWPKATLETESEERFSLTKKFTMRNTYLFAHQLQFNIGTLVAKQSHHLRSCHNLHKNACTILPTKDLNLFTVFLQNRRGFVAWSQYSCFLYVLYHALQTVLYFSSISSLLYHLGLLQLVFAGMAKILQLTLATTAIESFHAVVSIFLGMCESAIIVSPYLARQTESELFAILCSGFASSSVAMFSVYSMFGACPQYLVASSLMSAPASLACSKLALPETEPSTTRNSNFKLDKRQVELSIIRSQVNPHENLLDAISAGATNALKIILEMGANLVVFVALLALTNSCIRWLGDLVGILDLSLEKQT